MATKRILCVPSAAMRLTLKSGKQVDTGFFLSELAIPCQLMKNAGYQITYATVNGARPSLDPFSDKTLWFGFSNEEYRNAKAFIESEQTNSSFDRPVPLSSLTDAEMHNFAAIFIPGGHGPMVDLADNPDMGRILEFFIRNNKIVASICHGPAAFLSLTRSSPFLLKDYRLTCYSNTEENMLALVWFSTPQWRVASRLSEAGAIVSNSVPMSSQVVEDRNLITAQGPSGAKNIGNAVVRALEKLQPSQPPGNPYVPRESPVPADIVHA